MFNRASFTLALLALLALGSCKKPPPKVHYTISGIISDPYQPGGLAGATTTLSVQEIEGGVWSSGYRTIGSATSPESGNYSFTFEKTNAVQYRIEVRKDAYFGQEVFIRSDALNPNETFVSHHHLHSKAWLKTDLRNISPVDSLDELRYQQLSGVNNCSGCCNSSVVIYTGQTTDTSATCLLFGGRYTTFQYFVTKAGNINSVIDSVFCTPFDTTTHTIRY